MLLLPYGRDRVSFVGRLMLFANEMNAAQNNLSRNFLNFFLEPRLVITPILAKKARGSSLRHHDKVDLFS